jgi:SWI/SNF-related matrix-associated actin-dependent regulator 1 of chromatin subfamily A
MICKICNSEKKIVHQFKNLKTLECKHSFSVEPFIMLSSDSRTPMPFQYEGIDFSEASGFKCLIADEMGLGKTIQALGSLKKGGDRLLPVLIVVKSSLKMQWLREIIRWLGYEYTPYIISSGKDALIEGFNVYITSYDLLRRFSTETEEEITSKWGNTYVKKEKKSPFYTFPFKAVILDEVQTIKNTTSTRTDEVERICEGKEHVIALSGTPIKNNAHEYYTILHLLRPNLFPTEQGFTQRFVEMYLENGYLKYGGIRNPDSFKDYTKSFIIRRTRDEVLPELPKVNRMFHHVDFENEKLKKAYLSAEMDFVRELESKNKALPLDPLGALAKMRHLVGLNKIHPTVEFATEFLLETNRKLVIFTHHKDVMESIKLLITSWCLDGGYSEPVVYHAGLDMESRDGVIQKFRDDPNTRIMIASTLAASEGLNLQFCADCVFTERQFNPANEEQAESRFPRPGQTASQINATYMTATGTIDEWFTKLVEKKRAAMASTLDGKVIAWEESSLVSALYDAIKSKGKSL